MIAVERNLAADHPAAAGHFPGHPVIPGAALLDEIVDVLRASLGEELQTLEIRAAKFLRPVLPGDRILIVIETVSEFDYRFECKVQETTAVAGVLRYMGPARAHLAP